MKDFKDKVAVVTGAASCIDKGMGLRFYKIPGLYNECWADRFWIL